MLHNVHETIYSLYRYIIRIHGTSYQWSSFKKPGRDGKNFSKADENISFVRFVNLSKIRFETKNNKNARYFSICFERIKKKKYRQNAFDVIACIFLFQRVICECCLWHSTHTQHTHRVCLSDVHQEQMYHWIKLTEKEHKKYQQCVCTIARYDYYHDKMNEGKKKEKKTHRRNYKTASHKRLVIALVNNYK